MKSLIKLDSCQSTNDEIVKYASDHLPVGLYTFNQTAGRGQYGCSWHMPQEKNIAYSYCFASNASNLSASLLNFRTASILRDFVAKIAEMEAKVKWPNDIILNNKKVTGILLERRGGLTIIGIGFNVLQQDFDTLTKAGSILSQSGKAPELETIALQLHSELSNKLFLEEDSQVILDEYNRHLFRKDKVSVFEENGKKQNGIIRRADVDGYLHVETDSGMRRFYHKEITLVY